MPRKTIATIAAERLKQSDRDVLWAGDLTMCGEIYDEFGGRVEHPLNRVKAVIDAARRSPLFESAGYIRCCDSSGKREVLYPAFRLADE